MYKIATLIVVCCLQFFALSAKAEPSYPIEIDSSITEQAQFLLSGPNQREFLLSNILSSQFSIRLANGTFLGEGGQGLIIDEWNMDVMATALKKGADIRLKDYLLAWQLAGTAIHGGLNNNQENLNPEFLKRFQSDLIRAVQLSEDDHTGIRYLAHLIVALGRESSVPYDLLDANVNLNVSLNAVQYGLLTQRLAAEFWLLGKKYAPQMQKPVMLKFLEFDIKASQPCTMTDTEGLIMDGVAAGAGMMAPGFLEFLAESKFLSDVGVEKFNKIAGTANIVLNYVKLAWSIAAFKATLKAEKNPLTRTKTKIAGEQTELTAQFTMDGSSAQVVNCLRPALNMVGLDFSLPQGGPLAGSLVEWQIATRMGSQNDVVQTVGVDPLHQETDANGRSVITVEGKSQKTDLSHKKLLQVDREVEILASVNLKNKNPKQDAIDLFSGLSGLSALWSLPAEILNRAPLLFNAKTKLIVHDWKELEGDHFRVEATYHRADFRDRGVLVYLTQVTDKLAFDFEIKIDANTNVGDTQILSVRDGKTEYKEDMQPEFTAGEGCMGTQTPTGDYEAFILQQKPLITAVYQPGIILPPGVVLPPDVQLPSEGMIVRVSFNGNEHYRGWKFKVDDKSCEMDDIEEEDATQGIYAQVQFDSTQLNQVGKSITIDNTNNGAGWVFVITYVE